MKTQYYFSPIGQHSNEVIAKYLCERDGDPDVCTSINKMCGDKIPRDMFPIDEEGAREVIVNMKNDSRFTGVLLVDHNDGMGIVPLDFSSEKDQKEDAPAVPDEPEVTVRSVRVNTPPIDARGDTRRAEVAILRHHDFRIPLKINA